MLQLASPISFLIKMSFDNKTPTPGAPSPSSSSTWSHPEMLLKRTAKRPSLETSIRHPTISPIAEEPKYTDLYEVMPQPLCVEDAAVEASNISRLKSRPTPLNQQSGQSNRPPISRRARSNSLPVVHGNFVLLHRSSSRCSPDIR